MRVGSSGTCAAKASPSGGGWLRWLALVWALLGAAGSGSAGVKLPPGVVVEDVGKRSAAERAGIHPGDVVLSWSRPPSPGDAHGLRGVIDSPFGLADVEVEQAPRGLLALAGRSGQTAATWSLPPAPFGMTFRPQLQGELLVLYQEGRDLVQAQKVAAGAERWRAVAKAARQQGERALPAWLLGRAARALAEARLWPEADAAYEEAIREADAVPRSTTVAWLLREWGDTFHSRSDWARAEDCFQRALAIDAKLEPEGLAAAQSLVRLGLTAWRRGDLSLAEEHDRRALAIQEKNASQSLAVAETLNNLGNVMWRRDDLGAAEGYHQRARTIRESVAPGSLDVATSLNNLGNILWRRGNLAAAEAHHRRALEIRETLAPESLAVSMSLANLGLVMQERGDLEAALEFDRRALAIQEKLSPDSLSVATTLHNMALLARDRGDAQAAVASYRRALAIKEKLAPDSVDVAETLNNLASVLLDGGERAAAEEHYRRSLAIVEKLAPGSLAVATTSTHLGEIAAERGDLKQAEQYHRSALAIRERLVPGHSDEAESLHALGWIESQTGRMEAAAQSLFRALDDVEGQRARLGGTEESHALFLVKYAPYYHHTIDTLLQLGRPAEALRVLERSRARSLLALLAERDLLFSAELPADLAEERRTHDEEYDRVQASLAGLSPAKDETKIDALRGRLRDLRQRQAQIAAKIRNASPRLASIQYPQPLDLGGVREALDPGTVFLAYSVGEDKTFLFAVRAAAAGGSGLSVLPLPAGEKTLREKVEAFRHAIRQRRAIPREAFTAQAAELYDILLRPAESELAAGERLLISPDGPLHSLPFGALMRRDPRKPRAVATYLIEWKPLNTAASATVYAELKKARREATASGLLVAFGDPRYPALAAEQADQIESPELRAAVTRGFGLTPLPATRQEVEGIASLFPERAQKYLGDEATEERAKSVGKAARYVHFACHGYLDERFPLNSALALAIPEKLAEGQDNGLLQAWEIFEKLRIDADLVTLSACETALGKEMGGEGLLGLTRAFHYAGAKSVLASLWDVSDRSTALLMKRFYGYLKAGKTRDTALRAAQIDLIRTSPPKGSGATDVSQPFHWAAFQLSGDWK